jgi:osmoprotectant transport system substrate-binding protein
VALPPTPFTSSNEVAVTSETADRLGLSTISDLSGEAKKLTLAGSPECRHRQDCLLGLEQVYGLHFKRFIEVEIPHRHDVLTSGRADVSIVFTTDPQIKRNNEVLLEDDKGMLPPYNSTLVVRKQAADAAGADLQSTVEQINTGLTDETMQELNARVDLDHQDPGRGRQGLSAPRPAWSSSHAADLHEAGEPAFEQVRVLGSDLDGQLEACRSVR